MFDRTRGFVSYGACWLLPVLAGFCAQGAAAQPAVPVQVRDSVAMTRIAEPDQRFRASNDFKYSPDGSRVVVVTYKGNLDTWRNDYEMKMFDVDELHAFASEPGRPAPSGEILAEFSAASNDHSVRDVVWIDDETLRFVQEGANGEAAQVYSIDVESGVASQLTRASAEIESYALAPDTGRVVYAAATADASDPFAGPSFVIGNRNITQLTFARENILDAYQFYASLDGADVPIGEPFGMNGASPRDIWISPDGRRAISLKIAADLAPEWTVPDAEGRSAMLNAFDDYFMQFPRTQLEQYVLIDVDREVVRPVFAAPKTSSRLKGASWFPDGERVVLVGTHLPLDGVSSDERSKRIATPAIAEFDPQSGRVSRIADAVRGDDPRARLLDVSAASNDRVDVTWRASDGTAVRRVYEMAADGWRMTGESEAAPTVARDVRLEIRQSALTPPDIFVIDESTGAERRLTNFNPQFEDLAFGRVEKFEWKDSQDRDWKGAIVFPPDYDDAVRYPLVIQTTAEGGDGDAFEAADFLIDGPVYSSAYAAQSYAGRGMIVLQAPNPFPSRGALLSQLEDTQLLIEGAVDALDASGVIDRRRVALIGFSNTCVAVWHTLTHSDYGFAAAIVADGYSISHWGYAWTHGIRAPGMTYIDEFVMDGATPWGEGLDDYVALNPAFHLDNVEAAVRIEDYNFDSPPMDWDLYAIMRRMHRPVEYAVLNDGAHNNLKPRERFLSQQGNVDWLAFWLTGAEVDSGERASQYERWRRLRDLNCAREDSKSWFCDAG